MSLSVAFYVLSSRTQNTIAVGGVYAIIAWFEAVAVQLLGSVAPRTQLRVSIAPRAQVFGFTVLLCGAVFAQTAEPEPAERVLEFALPAGSLVEALEAYGTQSRFQIVYDFALIEGFSVTAVSGMLSAAAALEELLAGTGLRWKLTNGNTIVLSTADRKRRAAPRRSADSTQSASSLGDISVFDDPRQRLQFLESDAAFGLSRSLLETPRSMSVVGVDTIDLLGLSAVEDLVRVVPGAYTTTRWGIQGSIDLRNVPADTYFRGMKRLNLQGHGRSVLAAMETIEIVRGPPSPIYGMGKIGGYTNMEPKSVRASTGSYLLEPSGFLQSVLGTYDRSELSFGVGGPLPLADSQAGYYVYGLFEDSDTSVDHVPVEQSLLQLSVTIEDFLGDYRLETGINVQRSGTAGALMGRFTQDVADSGRYIRGEPLVDLDANGNGRIGYLEMYDRSPVLGPISSDNRALRQHWAWPLDELGRPLPPGQFPKVPGIPRSMYDYLLEHPDSDPGGLLRALGPGGPVPISGYVPAGFALDPATVGFDELDLRRSGAFEQQLEADFATVYFDLINDRNPNVSLKNQFFFDGMDQYKLSEQPFSQEQRVYVLEDKFTITRRLRERAEGPRINLIASANTRATSSSGRSASGDYGTHRTDTLAGDGLPGPNATFATALVNPDIYDDGLAWTSSYDTESWETGIGSIVELAFENGTELVIGGRWDYSQVRNVDYAGTLVLTAGSSAQPAVFTQSDASERGSAAAGSWSFSVSRELFGRVRPYLTVARSSLALDGNNNKYDNDVIAAGHIGESLLKEAGIKASLLGGRLFLTNAFYEQSRTDVSADDVAAVRNAHVSSTRTRGWEAELKWAASADLFMSFYALRQETVYVPNAGATIMVDARTLGFVDVVDSNGQIVFPAEAFLYGGRSYVVLPPGLDEYATKQGNPGTQLGFLAQYQLGSSAGLTFSSNYFSSVYSGRLKQVELPAAHVLNAGVFWAEANWQVKLDVLNLTDERYFRARTGDTLGDPLVSVMPDRRWQLTIRFRY